MRSREKRPAMLPQPGTSRLTKSPKLESGSVLPRIFSRSLLRRRRFYAILGFFILVLYYLRIFESSSQPLPGYETLFEEEMNHALDLGTTGDHVKYLHFKVSSSTRVDALFSKLLLHAHLAHATNRAYVFDPLEPKPKEPSSWSRKKVQPLSSLLSLGKDWDAKGGKFLPVSSLGWHYVCPPRQRKYLPVSLEDLGKVELDPSILMSNWVKRIVKEDARCVEIVGEPFPDSILESKMIKGLFDTISSSPAPKQYTFRHNIQAAASNILPIATQPSLTPTANNTVVLHSYIPTSGLDDPCSEMAIRGAPFRTFAHLKGIPTAFEIPANKQYYQQRCNPTIDQIIGRLGIARTSLPALRHVYVVDGPLGMTPEQWVERKRWFEELRFELTTKYSWESVRWAAAGAKSESVAIDMELASRSHAYVGNGFTDFSSNVVLLRVARGLPMGSLRFL
ncbi:unnamed protein product [Rhizoctonia solani]|uniref:Transmembrane protein n=1 Tax=Rhizoctonia solani TaxID=456999 RepID=A0A8H3CKM7_9AGAM|nr:unnamed protein product [Rhizoctonia solani]